MILRIVAALLLFLAFPPIAIAHEIRQHLSSTVIASSTSMPMFDTESEAHSHCPKDIVVWLNTKSGIWHEKGMRWYGRTRQGAYVCRKEAAAEGYRDTRNGQ
jgi:hypothetical protein